jgi:hypothetical protein
MVVPSSGCLCILEIHSWRKCKRRIYRFGKYGGEKCRVMNRNDVKLNLFASVVAHTGIILNSPGNKEASAESKRLHRK